MKVVLTKIILALYKISKLTNTERQCVACFSFSALNFSNHFALAILARKGKIDLFVVSIASFVNGLEIEP